MILNVLNVKDKPFSTFFTAGRPGSKFAWASLNAVLTLLIATIAYRIRLYFYITGLPESETAYPAVSGLYFFSDLVFLALVYFFLRYREWKKSTQTDASSRAEKLFQHKFIIIFIFIITFIYGSHLSMLDMFKAGLRLEFVLEVLFLFPLDRFFAHIGILDWALLFIPPVVFMALERYLPACALFKKKIVAVTVILLSAISLAPLFQKHILAAAPAAAKEEAPEDIQTNPALYFTQDLFSSGLRLAHLHLENSFLWASKPRDSLSKEQASSIRLIDPVFVRESRTPPRLLLPQIAKKWNVVFIIMESTGFRYVFDTSMGNETPMPFLRQLSKKSLFLKNHYAVSNSSPRSIFSMFSGLYPDLALNFFSLKKNNNIPSIATFLEPQYDSYLTTPFYLKYYFPRYFLRNSGVKNLYGFENIPVKDASKQFDDGRYEFDAIDFFIDKLTKIKEPFFGAYYSYVPHFPYRDYGADYALLKDGKKRIHRYYNNLRLLDTIIKKIYTTLEKTGKLENTILVLCGDHSEAFGQHEGNWIHSLAVYNENLHVPALFYQPKIFTPGEITKPTSHVDILPTLLDAMGIHYNEKLFQGESVFQQRFRRRYVFAMGIEDSIAAISGDNIKMIVNYQKNTCEVFDLNKNPAEIIYKNNEENLNCKDYPGQRSAIEAMRKYQPAVLHEYNDSRINRKKFEGESHFDLY